jgi:hypothetical protein
MLPRNGVSSRGLGVIVGVTASLGLLVRAAVGADDSWGPFEELGTAVVVGDLAFDQHWATCVLAGFADRVGQFVGGRRLQTKAVAVFGIPGINQGGVVPVLEVVVGPS